MRNYDFTPLWRSTVGFDHLFDLINNIQHAENQDNYPPYDIARTGEDTYRISLAVAGFSPEDLTVTAQQNLLAVSGRKSETSDHQYLYQGISARPFERRFSLEDHVEVASAGFENGASANRTGAPAARSHEAAPDRDRDRSAGREAR
jgi:molecular chaperone IbpA